MKVKIKVTTYEYNNTHTEDLEDPLAPQIDSVEDAIGYITDTGSCGLHATVNADGFTFSPALRELPHNCYSAPDYEIVKSKGC